MSGTSIKSATFQMWNFCIFCDVQFIFTTIITKIKIKAEQLHQEIDLIRGAKYYYMDIRGLSIYFGSQN